MKKKLSFLFLSAMLMATGLAGAQLALPLTMDFEADNSLTGWTVISNNEENEDELGRSTDAYRSGSYGFQFSSYNGADNDDYTQYLISPKLASGTRAVEVSFWYRNSEEDVEEYFSVGHSTTTSAPSAFTFQASMIAADAEWHLYTVSLPVGTRYVAIRYTASSDMYYLYIDDLAIESVSPCGQVANLRSGAVTATTVELYWTDPTNTGATYTVRNASTGSDVVAGLRGMSYLVQGLASSSDYTFEVLAHCTDGEVSRAASLVVRTGCGNVTRFPYTEGFEQGLGCWTTINGASEGYPWRDTVGDDNDYMPHSGNGMAMSASYDETDGISLTPSAWLISPQFDLPLSDTIELSYWYRVNENYPYEHFSIYVSTAGTDTAQFTTLLDSLTASADTTGWIQRTVQLTAYAGQSIHLAFKHHDCYDQWWLLLDDIRIEASQQQTPASYVVSISADPTQGSATGAGTYTDGQSVTLTATAASGYRFVGWLNGSDTIPDNPYTFTIQSDMDFTALFRSTEGIDPTAPAAFSVRCGHGRMTICGVEGCSVRVCDLGGRILHTVPNSPAELSLQVPATGVYLVSIDGQSACKVLVTK